MLRGWLSPMGVDEFVRTCLHRQAFAKPEAAREAVPRFGWETLDRVLAAQPDLIVISRGKPVDAPAPRSLEQLRPLMKRGAGVVIRRAERHDPGLAALAASFAED